MRAENPFATRHTQPGAMPFVAWPDRLLGKLLNQLMTNGWSGQIVGPHGSGKTTLIRELIPRCEEAGRKVAHFELRDRQRRLPQKPPLDADTLLVIDGFEQLGLWSRLVLMWRVRQNQAGLLVTAHQPRWRIPVVATTEPDPALLETLVAQLMQAEARQPPTRAKLDALLAKHDGNFREVFMELYDWYEQAG